MSLQAGKLDRRITILRSSLAPDGFGAKIPTWSPLATVWAAYAPVSDGERQRAAETGSTIDARFQVRWSALMSTVTAKDRLQFAGRTFNIQGVKELGRREGLEISAVARTDLPST